MLSMYCVVTAGVVIVADNVSIQAKMESEMHYKISVSVNDLFASWSDPQ